MKVRIYLPEGGEPFTKNVRAENIQSHRAANDWHSGEAELLADFMAADGIPDEMDGGWKLVKEGEEQLPDNVYKTSYCDYKN